MYLARSSPTVLTWFMDASARGLQRPHSGTPRPPGASTPSGPLGYRADTRLWSWRVVSSQAIGSSASQSGGGITTHWYHSTPFRPGSQVHPAVFCKSDCDSRVQYATGKLHVGVAMR